MNFKKSPRIMSICLLVGACGSPNAPAPDVPSGYVLEMSRSWPQGAKFQERTQYTSDISISAFQGNQTLQDISRRSKYRYEAEVEVLETAPAGYATKVRYTIDSMTGSVDGSPVETLASGSNVVAEAIGDTIIHSDFPRGLPPEIEGEIKGLLAAQSRSSYESLEALNPPGRVDIGDRWNVDGNAILGLLGADEYIGSAAQVSAWGRLEDAYPRDGVEMCLVVVFIEIDNKGAPVPPGTTLNKATITSTVTFEMPLDPTAPLRRQDQSFSVFVDASGGGAKFLSTVAAESRTTFEYK